MIYNKKYSVYFLLSVLCPLLGLSDSALGGENDSNRQATKLQPRTSEMLTPQELVEIYTRCISSSYGDPDTRPKNTISTGDLRLNCQEERKMLSASFSQPAINQIDSIYVSKYNEAINRENSD